MDIATLMVSLYVRAKSIAISGYLFIEAARSLSSGHVVRRHGGFEGKRRSGVALKYLIGAMLDTLILACCSPWVLKEVKFRKSRDKVCSSSVPGRLPRSQLAKSGKAWRRELPECGTCPRDRCLGIDILLVTRYSLTTTRFYQLSPKARPLIFRKLSRFFPPLIQQCSQLGLFASVLASTQPCI